MKEFTFEHNRKKKVTRVYKSGSKVGEIVRLKNGKFQYRATGQDSLYWSPEYATECQCIAGCFSVRDTGVV